jgi:hypothetical protein
VELRSRKRGADALSGQPMDVRALRILEIGDRGLFTQGLPAQTTLVWTGALDWHEASERVVNFSPSRIAWLRRALRSKAFDLVACHVPVYAPWSIAGILRRMFSRKFLAAPASLARSFGVSALPRALEVPLVMLDTEDTPAINRHAFGLLDRARLYFKRELPIDHWRAFFKTAHADLPTRRMRLRERELERVAKLRPLSLGAPAASLAQARFHTGEKTADVFFAGQLAGSSTVRAAGQAQLAALHREGLRIDIPERSLPLVEFLARCGRAWLTWSPEGYGWDCFRHYEAPLVGSVPVISRASTYRHAPLRHGEHCFYYDVEGQGLAETIRAGLADKARLERMARAACEFVHQHHTQQAVCEYVLRTVFDEGRESS